MYDRIVSIICEQLGIDRYDVNEDTKIMEDLGADSLDIVDMLITLEDEFGIHIPDEEIENLNSVGDVTAFLESRA